MILLFIDNNSKASVIYLCIVLLYWLLIIVVGIWIYNQLNLLLKIKAYKNPHKSKEEGTIIKTKIRNSNYKSYIPA